MAVLTNGDRLAAAGEVMRDIALPGLVKADIRAAVSAIDTWVSDNAASLNSAIPQPARGVLTVSQKAQLLQYVVAKRYIKGV